MFERKIEKYRFERMKPFVKPRRDGIQRDLAGFGVELKRPRAIVKEIARKLIQHDDQRKSRARRRPPRFKLSTSRTLWKIPEPILDFFIERVAPAKPKLALCLRPFRRIERVGEPKGEDLLWEVTTDAVVAHACQEPSGEDGVRVGSDRGVAPGLQEKRFREACYRLFRRRLQVRLLAG